MRSFVLAAVAFAAIAAPALAQKPTHPAPGSPVRKAILDRLRVHVEKSLHPKIVFVCRDFNVVDDWAYVGGEVQRPNGKPVDFNKLPEYRELIQQGIFDGPSLMALLRKKSGAWKVIAWVVGPTDVSWDGWDKQFGAPRSVFPKLGG